jgi:hypothetical protein
MTYKYFIPVIIVFLSLNGFSQDFESYKKQQQENFEKFRQEREDQLKKYDESFKLYVQKQNEEFAKYIEKNWVAFNTFKGENRPERPKPNILPIYSKIPGDLVPEKIEPTGLIQIETAIKPIPEPLRIPKPDYSQISANENISFLLYGQNIELSVDPDLFCDQQININQKAIAKLWNDFIKADYGSLIDQLYDFKDRYNLNDWGYFKLCESTANVLSKHDTSYKRTITWALMNLSGYKIKIGVSDESCYIMIPTLQKVFSIYSMKIENEKYYILNFHGNNIKSYKQDFEGADKIIDLNIYKPLNLGGNTIKTNSPNELISNWNVEVDKNVIDFYNDYPLVDFPVYFNAPMTPVTRNSIIAKFQPQLENKSDREKVEFLLHFVQNAFQYETDLKQFGKEKFFFPDELFYYPSSDCEDRSVLFSFLVRWFVGYDIIGLNYPGHLATAIALPGEIIGTYLEFNGKIYTICDPTYINAPIGLPMPEYARLNPSIILISNSFSNSEIAEKNWSDLIDKGASKTCLQNSCFDVLGNCYLAGTFNDTITITNRNIFSASRGTDVFVACFNNKGILSWINKIDNGIYDYNNGITIDNNKLYLSGNSSSIDGKDNHVFISSFSLGGEQLWNSSFSIDNSLVGANINKTYHFTLMGKVMSEKLSFSGNQVSNSGISVSGKELIVNLNFTNSLGLRKEDIVTAATSEMNIIDRLKIEYDKFVQANCEQYTAAVLSVFNLMKFNGMLLTGLEISDIIEKNSPENAANISDLIKNLKKVDYFKNENGRIILKTKNGKGVSLYKMYFSDNATIKISNVTGQKTQVDCLSGVKVGNTVIKFPLNCITVDPLKGDFLFDYGKDHSKENVNLKRDILKI